MGTSWDNARSIQATELSIPAAQCKPYSLCPLGHRC
jgi:hypothetical protein